MSDNKKSMTCSASKRCNMEGLLARKGGSRDGITTSQDFSLMEAVKFSREFYGLIGSHKKRH